MNEEKYRPICKCGESKKIIKFGKRNNIQRYYCQECKKTFFEKRKRVEYRLRDKIFLSMLKKLMQPTDAKIAVDEAIANIDSETIDISNVRFTQRVPADSSAVFCYNPRLLICEDGPDIILFRFEERNEETENSRSFKIIDQNERSRNRKQFTTQNKAE